MSIPNPHIRFSYEDYRSLVATSDKRYELFDGDIVMVPSPTTAHQQISRNLGFLLLAHVRARKLGTVFHAPMDVVFGKGIDREVAQPDLLFVRAERRAIIGHDAIGGAPIWWSRSSHRARKHATAAIRNLSMRVLASPSTGSWTPRRRPSKSMPSAVDGYEMKGRYRKGDRFASPLFPGLTLPLDEVFEAE